jgi:hypothetical protein
VSPSVLATFRRMKIKALFLLIPFLLLTEYTSMIEGCNTNKCVNQAIKHLNDYVECDMCNCDKLCDLSRDETYYNCFVEVNSVINTHSFLFTLTLI